MYGIAGFRDPTNSAKSKNKRTLIDNKLQQWVKENGKMLICGHTHNSYFQIFMNHHILMMDVVYFQMQQQQLKSQEERYLW